jgi:hypothetical protein
VDVTVRYEGEGLPEEAASPWSRFDEGACCVNGGAYGHPCDPKQPRCSIPAEGRLTVTKVGNLGSVDHGVNYRRDECAATLAGKLSIEGRVAVQPDVPTPDCSMPAECPQDDPALDACPSAVHAILGIYDGDRIAALGLGRVNDVRFGRPADETFAAFDSLDFCARTVAGRAVAYAPDIDITAMHTYRVEIERHVAARLFVDGVLTLTVPYAALPKRPTAGPASGSRSGFGFRTERAVATWDYVRYATGVDQLPSFTEPLN